VTERAGKPIASIFADDGEAEFRRIEREVVALVATEPARCPQCANPRPAVISTGGGVLMDESNYAALARVGVIVCLTASPQVIAARIGRSAFRRPKLLEGGKPLPERISELLEERALGYARADVSVDTSNLPIDEVVERVLDAFCRTGRSRWALSA
ncbi:MAG TPA: shikimate kinase, partial [Candidatus Binataceae bacterium]|nr:shikimate kinase [Candidatus Binataceae bacterium]